ncbi:hypothetical protein [Halodesulfurarchaeum sp.]|uniref:hypothetical protein n=1 Tax=Halodesulfurarchaeum sp. TaxID=1980530 RepID=UPI001BC76F0E|nr:hypothetical protein [Halodesulfurarchaeum sp.]
MMGSIRATGLSRFRKPAYVGENRCTPCTVLNSAIALGLVTVTAFVSRWGAIVVGVIAFGAIWLRGYLIPGTPTVTHRYFPPWLLSWFGKSPPEFEGSFFDVDAFLCRVGVLESGDGDLAVAPSFETRLAQVAAEIDDSASVDGAGALFDVNPDRVTFDGNGPVWTVFVDDHSVGRWESRVAFVIDLAADELLASWTDEWAHLSLPERNQSFAAIRVCLDNCPVCGGVIELGTELVESCCRDYHVITASCTGCVARLFEINARSVPDAI